MSLWVFLLGRAKEKLPFLCPENNHNLNKMFNNFLSASKRASTQASHYAKLLKTVKWTALEECIKKPSNWDLWFLLLPVFWKILELRDGDPWIWSPNAQLMPEIKFPASTFPPFRVLLPSFGCFLLCVSLCFVPNHNENEYTVGEKSQAWLNARHRSAFCLPDVGFSAQNNDPFSLALSWQFWEQALPLRRPRVRRKTMKPLKCYVLVFWRTKILDSWLKPSGCHLFLTRLPDCWEYQNATFLPASFKPQRS